MKFPYQSLKDFIACLEQEGELVRITEKVSADLEIAEITDRVSKSKDGGKALLFTQVEGSKVPLLINAYGSYKRIGLALGVKNLDEIGQRIDSLIKMKPPETLMEGIKMLPTLLQMTKFPPKMVKEAPCQEVVLTGDSIDLDLFPILKCWPDDGGRFVTFPVVFTKNLNKDRRNAGMYRLQVYDKKTTGMHWHIHKDGAHYFHEYKKSGKRMEVAVAIGTDPVVTFAATAPMPRDLDEMLLAGFIRGKGVEMVPCKTIDMEVPAHAEIILEGYVEPGETRLEGPFGDHTGYYSLPDQYPVFHLTAITHCRNPVYFTTIVGRPPMEDCYLGKATERIFLPLLKTQLPEIVDMNLPWEGIFHNIVIVSIKKEYPMHAKKVMHALWGMGQIAFSKMILIVDEEVNVQDVSEVAWRAFNNVDPKRDLFFSEGILDVLDHSSENPLYGSKLGIDATRKWKSEGFVREWPEVIKMDPAVKAKIDGLWGKLGL